MTTQRDAEELLGRLLHSGPIRGVPRRIRIIWTPSSPWRLEPWIDGVPMPSGEINDALAEWLASVRADIDHVTLRRRMVDCGFLKRRTDGRATS